MPLKLMSLKNDTPFDAAAALLTAFATNNRINIYLIRNVPDEAWRAVPPGGKGRDIASMAAHIHNVRLMWLKSIQSPDNATPPPEKLEGETVTKEQAVTALEASFAALEQSIRTALLSDGRVKSFKPDVCSFVAYLFAHEGHHRGQITMLARQMGHPVSKSAMFGLWEWGTR